MGSGPNYANQLYGLAKITFSHWVYFVISNTKLIRLPSSYRHYFNEKLMKARKCNGKIYHQDSENYFPYNKITK